MGLISAWFRHGGSRHNLTIPLALGTNTKLLHHSTDLSTPSGTRMSTFVAFLTPPGTAFEVQMSCVSVVLGMVCCLVLVAM